MSNDDRNERLVTGEPLETPEGVEVPAQQNVGYGVEEGGGEWPDPHTEPRLPAPGGVEGGEAEAGAVPLGERPAFADEPPRRASRVVAAKPDHPERAPVAPDDAFNVIAAFDREDAARSAAEDLVRRGVPDSAIRIRRPGEGDGDERAEQRAEIQDELDESWGGPSIGLLTKAQAKGALAGTVVLGAAGAVLGLVGGLIWAWQFDTALGPVGQVVVAALITGTAGATIGFLAGGGLEPRREAAGDPTRPMDDQRLPAERDVLVAVHTGRREVAEQAAAALRTLGADRVHLVDAEGTPLPRQSEHPRPADPEGWWWRRAGQG